jgi:monoamine oxidase
MARTPLLRLVARLAAEHAEAARRGIPVDDLVGEGLTRREVLRGASALAALAVAPSRVPPRRATRGGSRIAIVGAGLAGLTAALALHDAGVAATVYEASGHVGGRIESDSASWAAGQVSEHCAELIDSGHATVRRLARRFGLPLDDLRGDDPPGATDTYFLDGGYYPLTQARRDFEPVFAALSRDVREAGFPTLHTRATPAGRALDAMSVRDWIATRVPGGTGSRLGRLLEVAYVVEYGLDATAQSALNLVYLLGSQPSRGGFAIFGSSDERFHVRGGNERLPQAIAAALPAGTIELGMRLTALARDRDGTLRLSFAGAPAVEADHVVLTPPFSVLRALDLAGAGFDAVKRRAIAELGYGTNAKLALQFHRRLWRTAGPWGRSSGSSFADVGYQNTWEVTRRQPGREGILVQYSGGSAGRALADTSPAGVTAAARAFLAQLGRVFPGIAAEWTGRATLSAPAVEPLRRGSYACWRVGQYTSLAGAERARSGRCHFAGEHCSIEFQGFMEGAASEGMRAAGEILRDLGRAGERAGAA